MDEGKIHMIEAIKIKNETETEDDQTSNPIEFINVANIITEPVNIKIEINNDEPLESNQEETPTDTTSIKQQQIYKCETCKKSYKTQFHYNQHKKNHNKIGDFKCEVCSKRFLLSHHLTKHMMTHSTTRIKKCLMCEKIFSTSSNLNRHYRVKHRQNPENDSNLPPSNNDVKIEESVRFDEVYIKCENTVETRDFKCDECDKAYGTKGHLNRHKKVAHNCNRPFRCDTCDDTFKLSHHLDRHKRVIHGGERPYRCDVCHKSFGVISTLKSHLRIHSGERPYVCEICNKSFVVSSHLNKHKKVKHLRQSPLVKRRKCDSCEKHFYDLSSLKRHKNRFHAVVINYSQIK